MPAHRYVRQGVWGMLAGGVLALYTFMEDALRTASQGTILRMALRPTRFDWPLFLVALALLSLPVAELAWRARPAADRRGETIA